MHAYQRSKISIINVKDCVTHIKKYNITSKLGQNYIYVAFHTKTNQDTWQIPLLWKRCSYPSTVLYKYPSICFIELKHIFLSPISSVKNNYMILYKN